ncbi:response regulator [Stenotrophomonas aracearum]|jgi:CheY-like chemotaxis protein|uniref:Response regulator n=1 Tax=Stenotrophomonas aracearum TaxID=3003272 RepID=A0ABY9YG47_9GAMM|nr:response regulator [Stenotrophomonas sp. A5588]WNH49591.1 response regulator [Stenotrophomonas sp. A5588]
MLLPNKKLHVFLVEDEPTLMDVVEQTITQLGHSVTERAERLEDALSKAAAGGFDVAVLDVNLNGQDSFPVADALIARGIPFVFTTGFGANNLPERFQGGYLLEKPFRLRDIGQMLDRLAQSL